MKIKAKLHTVIDHLLGDSPNACTRQRIYTFETEAGSHIRFTICTAIETVHPTEGAKSQPLDGVDGGPQKTTRVQQSEASRDRIAAAIAAGTGVIEKNGTVTLKGDEGKDFEITVTPL